MTHDMDYIERWRATWYPALHKVLDPLGLYATATVTERQYVATLQFSEEELEEELLHEPHYWERNPIAAFKGHPDGRESTLSLRLRHADTENYGPYYADPGMQLHWTLLPSAREGGSVDIYAHHEDDWMVSPIDHLRGANVSTEIGVKRSIAFLRNETYYEKGDGWFREER